MIERITPERISSLQPGEIFVFGSNSFGQHAGGAARQHQELTFLVTPIGCGIAGYTAQEIAPFFADAKDLTNVYLPESFLKVLLRK